MLRDHQGATCNVKLPATVLKGLDAGAAVMDALMVLRSTCQYMIWTLEAYISQVCEQHALGGSNDFSVMVETVKVSVQTKPTPGGVPVVVTVCNSARALNNFEHEQNVEAVVPGA